MDPFWEDSNTPYPNLPANYPHLPPHHEDEVSASWSDLRLILAVMGILLVTGLLVYWLFV